MSSVITQFKNAIIYQGNQQILSDVNLRIEAGEFVFLIGKTGTGKSSLIKTMYADLPLKTGKGVVCNYVLEKIKQRQIPYLRRKIGVVFQDFKLLTDRTVYDNLHFVMKATGWRGKNKSNLRIEEVLETIGVIHTKNKYPFELSGGEQQRVAIARALLNNPEIIIADEPTGNLDPKTSEEIMQVFLRLHKKGMTILMATHDYNMIVKYPGRIIQCEKGEIFDVVHQ